jgi:hypothetical protein
MGLKILDVGSKFGPPNKNKILFSVVKSDSDSTTAKANMNCWLNI